jgi:hypothetical protein
MTIHMVKLCVGAETFDDLRHWQAQQMRMRSGEGRAARPACQTRMTPKQTDALLEGGSLYWVIRGMILARNRIVGVETLTDRSGRAFCEIDLDPEAVLVEPTPRKAFQGWRYLKPAEAPCDLARGLSGELPVKLARDLREAGVW